MLFALGVLIVLGIGSGAAAAASPALTAWSAINTLAAPLQLQAWTLPNCRDEPAWAYFDNGVLARNISNWYISRSFQLNRTLVAQEQLDISVINNYSTWYPDKDQLSYDSSSCTAFWQSYYAHNGTTACDDTPPITCHRLWNNPGLPTT
ncbi:hypothetical protein N7451_012425 [Penicillium sp. IBT 35674x]|nr:hypothetical protein N7451_012425 [Penicillium sp. IBT 35674x]